MTIKGQLLDSSNNNPVAGATFSVYYSGNMLGPANSTFQSDQNGNYNYTDVALDTASDPAISVQAPGYLEAVGDPGFFNGGNTLDPAQVNTTSVPVWVWILVAVLGVISFIYLNKKYKLI